MGAAEHLTGQTLKGIRKSPVTGAVTDWAVHERLTGSDDLTPGQFSIGYRVVGSDGREAFMKVSDLDLLTGDGDLVSRMLAASQAHKFERDVLEYCRGNNMDRIVTAIDYGNARVEINDEKDVLFYLVFELAQGDIRKQVRLDQKADFLWIASALHHLSIAVQQLHSGGVCHNDIKPANFLLFNEHLQKLADLGRATSDSHHSVHDEEHDVGDPTYAAPEILYAHSTAFKSSLCLLAARKASDLYQLGSVAWFMVTGRMLTPAIVERLSPSHQPPGVGGGWNGRFHDVLPYWREAMSRAVEDDFLPSLAELTAGGRTFSIFREIVLQLTEPDPSLRGHPLNRAGQQDPLAVERYIAAFDLLRKEITVRPS